MQLNNMWDIWYVNTTCSSISAHKNTTFLFEISWALGTFLQGDILMVTVTLNFSFQQYIATASAALTVFANTMVRHSVALDLKPWFTAFMSSSAWVSVVTSIHLCFNLKWNWINNHQLLCISTCIITPKRLFSRILFLFFFMTASLFKAGLCCVHPPTHQRKLIPDKKKTVSSLSLY